MCAQAVQETKAEGGIQIVAKPVADEKRVAISEDEKPANQIVAGITRSEGFGARPSAAKGAVQASR